jgi:uncharacterized membrane protein
MRESSVQFEKKRLIGILSVLTFGLTALFAVLGLGSLVPTTFVLGFFLVVPLVALLGDSLPFVANEGDGTYVAESDELGTDPIEELRARYARGELTDEEFERRLERLLDTEGVEVAGSGNETERVFEHE